MRYVPSPIFLGLVAAFAGCMFYLWKTKGADRLGVFAFVVVGWVLSLCLHEFAHAVVAYWGGDRSVADKGYLSLDPLRYTQPGISLALPVLFILAGGVGLPGGAVYVQRGSLKSRATSSAVSAAGPLANLMFALLMFAPFLIDKAALARHPNLEVAFAALGVLQVVAVLLNLLPIPPLDGFGIIEPLIVDPRRTARRRTSIYLLPLVLVVLFHPGGPAQRLWKAAYNVGYSAGVPHGAASEGLTLFRFWTHSTAMAPSLWTQSTTPQTTASPPVTTLPTIVTVDGLTAAVAGPTPGGGLTVTLHWNSPASETLTVWRSDGTLPFRDARTPHCTGTPYSESCDGQAPGHQYTYYVASGAFQAETVSQKLASVTVNLPGSIPVPSGLTATINQRAQVVLQWNPPVGYWHSEAYVASGTATFRAASPVSCAGTNGHFYCPRPVTGHSYTYYVVTEVDTPDPAYSRPASVTVTIPTH